MKDGISNTRIPWNKGLVGSYSAEYREKLSKAKKGKPSSFKGRHHSESAIALIKEKRQQQTNCGRKKGCASPFKGKKHSTKTIELLRKNAKSQTNRKGPKGKPWSEQRRLAQNDVIRKKTRKRIIVKPSAVIRNKKEYHPAWNEIRKIIYRRDCWSCKCCGKKLGRRTGIACHHIDYDVKNNEPENLITLCVSCHAKTNFKRIDWMKYFLLQISKKERFGKS